MDTTNQEFRDTPRSGRNWNHRLWHLLLKLRKIWQSGSFANRRHLFSAQSNYRMHDESKLCTYALVCPIDIGSCFLFLFLSFHMPVAVLSTSNELYCYACQSWPGVGAENLVWHDRWPTSLLNIASIVKLGQSGIGIAGTLDRSMALWSLHLLRAVIGEQRLIMNWTRTQPSGAALLGDIEGREGKRSSKRALGHSDGLHRWWATAEDWACVPVGQGYKNPLL
jgi:hypothetical protein